LSLKTSSDDNSTVSTQKKIYKPNNPLTRMDKRGQGMSVSTLILIILGIFILVVLILGFVLGWSKLAFWIKSDNNSGDIANKCEYACGIQSQYDFCVASTKLTLPEADLAEADKATGYKMGTCKFFATDEYYSRVGIQDCPEITCA